MGKSAFRQEIEAAIQGRHSSVHPWSEAWYQGRLNRKLLGEWAKQHYHYVSQFPWWCGIVYANAPTQDIREFLLENMAEEEGMVGAEGFPKVKHTDLLLDFAEHCGKSRKEIEDAQLNGELLAGTLGLQGWCFRMAYQPTHVAAAGLLVGLESQVPQIYSKTTPPLIEKYGFTEEEVVFFRLHIVADEEHGERGFEILERMCDNDRMKTEAVRAVKEATQMRRLYLDSLYHEFLAPKAAMAAE